ASDEAPALGRQCFGTGERTLEVRLDLERVIAYGLHRPRRIDLVTPEVEVAVEERGAHLRGSVELDHMARERPHGAHAENRAGDTTVGHHDVVIAEFAAEAPRITRRQRARVLDLRTQIRVRDARPALQQSATLHVEPVSGVVVTAVASLYERADAVVGIGADPALVRDRGTLRTDGDLGTAARRCDLGPARELAALEAVVHAAARDGIEVADHREGVSCTRAQCEA